MYLTKLFDRWGKRHIGYSYWTGRYWCEQWGTVYAAERDKSPSRYRLQSWRGLAARPV